MEEQTSKTCQFVFTQAGKQALSSKTTLIVCAGITSQTFARINFGESWQKVADGQVHDAKKDKTENKCECYLLAHNGQTFLFLLPDLKEGLSSLLTNQLTNSLWQQVASPSFVLVLRELYKTAYTGPPEDTLMPEGKLKLITHRTSHLAADELVWLNERVGTAAHFTIMAGGLGARLLTYCEMYGMPGVAVTAITDSHYVSSDSLKCYTEVFSHLGLNEGTWNCANIQLRTRFKEILKDANQRGHAIFS